MLAGGSPAPPTPTPPTPTPPTPTPTPTPRTTLRLLVPPRAWAVISNAADRAGLQLEGRVLESRIDVRVGVGTASDVLDRWRTTPSDVATDAVTLALWYAARGRVLDGGYTIQLRHGRYAPDVLTRVLAHHGIAADVRPRVLAISRPGDRVTFRRLVAPYVALPTLKEAGQERQRRPPLPETAVEEIRRRAALGEPYADIARTYDINPRTVGKIARGETHADPSVCIVRRRAQVKRLSHDDEAKARAFAQDGLSHHAIAHLLGTNQPRISRLLRRRAA